METKINYTTRVRLDPDGIYRWKSPAQYDSDKSGYRLGLVVCAVVSVLSLTICAVISIDFMIAELPVILGSVAALILIIFLVGKLSSAITQKYEMNDSYVKIADPDKPVSYDFDRISEIVVNPLYLELHAGAGSSRIYAPKEDYYFVKDYIVGHTLGKAVVRYDKCGIGYEEQSED